MQELRNIRLTYNLSCRTMSLVLGLGVNQWRLMEKGGVISPSTKLLIMVCKDPRSFKKLMQNFEFPLRRTIGPKKYTNLLIRIDNILAQFQDDEKDRYEKFCSDIFSVNYSEK